MNSDNLLQLLHNGLRASLGATTSFVETLQDSQKREETISQLSSDLSQKVTEWTEKGKITEQEARSLIDQMIRQKTSSDSSPPTGTTVATTATPRTTPVTYNAQLDIEELTTQISAMRTELEQLRQSSSDN